MNAAAVLAIMCTLVPPADGERDRYALIAQTIAETATADARDERTGWAADELAAMLIATARHESDFRRAVHSGKVRGRAGEVCLMQINPKSRRVGRQHHWSTLAGVDLAATRRCIETGADHYERHEQVCGRSFGCALARYQGHKTARNKQTQRRLGTFWRVLGMLRSRASVDHPQPLSANNRHVPTRR